jgi:signal transduction histidine kinase
MAIIRQIYASSGMLAQTINDFLDVSRIEQGRMNYNMKTFSCDDLVSEIVQELQPIAQERGLDLSFDDTCKGKCVVNADDAKMRHIFFNLIDNAIKYTKRGWVKVHTELKDRGKTVRIKVSDSGIGIDPDELPNLFEKFVRAEGASGVNVNGTGLGLFVARQMVKAHKGKIWAESAGKGKGSTFMVELPVVTAAAKKTATHQ